MAFSVKTAGERIPVGKFWQRTFVIDEVDSTGASVDLRGWGVHTIESVVGHSNEQSSDGIGIAPNSATLSQTQDDPGQLFIKTSSGTDDVAVTVVYR